MTLQEILAAIPHITALESTMIQEAYNFAETAHLPQKRRSGEPYFMHVAAVAGILAKLGMDAQTVTAGLLHDVVEDTSVPLEEIQTRFGDEVAQLVDGVTKISVVSKENRTNHNLSEAEYLRKTIHAMRDDVRVILVKLADRLHNMRTLGSLKPERQTAISRETLDLFAPLATRLGMWQFKSELEDLSFRYLEPESYHTIEQKLREHEQEIDHFTSEVITELQAALQDNHLQAVLKPNPLHIYTIYSEMKRARITFEETFGARSIRVIVPDVMTCYQVLGVVHQLWRPIPGRFADYIAAPKDRFYQSLHTSVFHEDGGLMIIQIRTQEMDINAEYGVVAYWRYKDTDPDKFHNLLKRRLDYLHTLIEPAETEDTPEGFVQSVIENIDSDRIYALTPKGDILDLPRGATPIDFAYHIHTEVGHRCRGARVNGKLVPLDYEIQTGDRVEIYTTSRGGPNLDWLDESLGYVRTNRAKISIRTWFRRQAREEMITAGRSALDEKLKQMGLEIGDYEQLRSKTDYSSVDDMLENIGKGFISAAHMISKNLDKAENGSAYVTEAANLHPITGARGYDVKLARCCKPTPPDEIVGYVTREAKVSVHRRDCPILNKKSKIADRLIPVRWASRPKPNLFRVPVELRTLDRAGMMGEIGSVVAKENVNISNVNILTDQGYATFYVTMEIDSYATLNRVLTKIKSLEGVLEARRRATA